MSALTHARQLLDDIGQVGDVTDASQAGDVLALHALGVVAVAEQAERIADQLDGIRDALQRLGTP